MSHSQIIKEYSPKELEELCKNYSLVSVQDANGKKIIPWTPSNKTIKQHLGECLKRLQMEVYPDGFYFFCFAQNRRATTDNYDKYLFKKGNPKAEVMHQQLSENQKNITMQENALSFTSALGYITKIAELTAEVNTLKAEVQRLKDENAVLDAELEDIEKNGLSEGEQSDTMSFLKESQPAIMSAVDRYFEIQDRKLSLQEKALGKGKLKPFKRPTVPQFEPGSNEHLDFIRKLHKNNHLQQMDKELDKLEEKFPEQYETICTELNLFEPDDNEPKE